MYGKPSPFLAQLNHDYGVDGLGMLIAQAGYSFELWTGICAKTLLPAFFDEPILP